MGAKKKSKFLIALDVSRDGAELVVSEILAIDTVLDLIISGSSLELEARSEGSGLDVASADDIGGVSLTEDSIRVARKFDDLAVQVEEAVGVGLLESTTISKTTILDDVDEELVNASVLDADDSKDAIITIETVVRGELVLDRGERDQEVGAEQGSLSENGIVVEDGVGSTNV